MPVAQKYSTQKVVINNINAVSGHSTPWGHYHLRYVLKQMTMFMRKQDRDLSKQKILGNKNGKNFVLVLCNNMH